MPNRSHIGLDNPALQGRVRQPSVGATTLVWSQPSKAIVSGILTQPFYKPQPKSEVAPPELWRYRSTVEDAVQRSLPEQLVPSVVSELTMPTAQAEPGRPIFEKPIIRNAQPGLRPIESPRILATALPARSAGINSTPELSEDPPEEVTSSTLTPHQPQASKVLARPSQTRRDNYLPQATDTPATKLNLRLPDLKKLPKPSMSQIRSRLSGYTRLQFTLVAMAVVMFFFGLSVSLNTLHTNHLASGKVAAISQGAGDQSAAGSKAGKSNLPSTVRPTAAAVSNYAVGPSMPRYLNIPKLGVHARVLSLGILNNGDLATPNNVFDVGWYNESSLPGQDGAMLIDGHVSSWTTHGVFYGIKTLSAGDELQIVRGDGKVFNYQVVKTHIYDNEKVDMQSAVTPVVDGKGGLNLITCTGDVIPGTNEFSERVIVYASQV